jgi:hypothetical protein
LICSAHFLCEINHSNNHTAIEEENSPLNGADQNVIFDDDDDGNDLYGYGAGGKGRVSQYQVVHTDSSEQNAV